MRRGEGWVALMQARLAQHAPDWSVVNASISGETTAGGARRLAALLERHAPRLVVIELGANDALRGLDLSLTEGNLREMVRASRYAGARVLLLGMRVPPNYGTAYTERFARMFGAVARAENVPLVPFFLDGVAQHAELFQADRIHPTEQAQARMLDNVWPTLARAIGAPG